MESRLVPEIVFIVATFAMAEKQELLDLKSQMEELQRTLDSRPRGGGYQPYWPPYGNHWQPYYSPRLYRPRRPYKVRRPYENRRYSSYPEESVEKKQKSPPPSKSPKREVVLSAFTSGLSVTSLKSTDELDDKIFTKEKVRELRKGLMEAEDTITQLKESKASLEQDFREMTVEKEQLEEAAEGREHLKKSDLEGIIDGFNVWLLKWEKRAKALTNVVDEMKTDVKELVEKLKSWKEVAEEEKEEDML